MAQRFKRPAIWRPLALSVCLLGFLGYLGYSAVNGQFGFESQTQMQAQIVALQADSDALRAEIEAFRHRVSLFSSAKLDPDIVTERARALLSMASAEDILVMVNPDSGKPISSSIPTLAETQLTDIIVTVTD